MNYDYQYQKFWNSIIVQTCSFGDNNKRPLWYHTFKIGNKYHYLLTNVAANWSPSTLGLKNNRKQVFPNSNILVCGDWKTVSINFKSGHFYYSIMPLVLEGTPDIWELVQVGMLWVSQHFFSMVDLVITQKNNDPKFYWHNTEHWVYVL